MIVRPNELANLCSIFISIRDHEIVPEDLKRFIRNSMLLGTYSTEGQVIGASLNSGLIASKSGLFCLTKKGEQLGKLQQTPCYQMLEKAREYFINNVLLNLDSGDWCCGQFLMKFHVDTVLGTFVYTRNIQQSEQDIRWLMLLNDVGLIIVDEEKAIIKPEYLGVVNGFLNILRNPIPIFMEESDEENNKVGALAEAIAMNFEKRRLTENGYSALAPLVQQISTVDRSAGYDILSFQGIGDNPDSPRLIEVKGTRKPTVRFIWSYNERLVAEKENNRYWIYVFTNVNLDAGSAVGPLTIESPNVRLSEHGYKVVSLDVCVSQD